ncbi:MAG: hypothetical protein HQ512_06530 [Rhodospirillales bacterium]|nr:hypothetical protein [Rhodospirillales bacterium]
MGQAQEAPSSSGKGEVMRTALRLIKTKGPNALDYANHKVEVILNSGDEDDKAYWKKISKQIELLLFKEGYD